MQPEASPSGERHYRSVGEVRTFAIRQTRMTDAQRRALEELGPRYIVAPPVAGAPAAAPGGAEAPPVAEEVPWPRGAFPRPRLPLILEIGFGMGEATAELADRQRRFNLLGIEVHRPGVGKLLLEIEKRDLDNLRICTTDGVTLVRDHLADESLDAAHIFFPDPWPKKRHHKRRLIQPEFLRLLARRVLPGGYLYLVTDWEDYAQQMLEAADLAAGPREPAAESAAEAGKPHGGPKAGPGFVNPYHGYAPPRPWRPTTSFERKARAKGHSIFELFLIRDASGIVSSHGHDYQRKPH